MANGRCGNCREIIELVGAPGSVMVCPKCVTRLTLPGGPPPAAAIQPTRRSRWPIVVAVCIALAIAGPLGWFAAEWASHIRDPGIITIGNQGVPIEEVLPPRESSISEDVAQQLKAIREELGSIRKRQELHARALNGVAGFIDTQKRIDEYGGSEVPVRWAENTTGDGLREILSGAPPAPERPYPENTLR